MQSPEWALRQEAERRSGDWMRANIQVRQTAVAGVGTSPGAGAPASPVRARNPTFPTGGSAARAHPLQARQPAAAPGYGSPPWAGVAARGTMEPALANLPPGAVVPRHSAFGFGGEPQAVSRPQGTAGGGNSQAPGMGQSAHLELEMLRLEKERERLLLEQEVEMLRLENEIRERGMELMQNGTVLGRAETAGPFTATAALFADTMGEISAAATRVTTLRNNLVDDGGNGVAPQVAPGNNQAVSQQREIIELGDSSDEDEGGTGVDTVSVPPSGNTVRASEPTQNRNDAGDSSMDINRSNQHSQGGNAATENANIRISSNRSENRSQAEKATGQRVNIILPRGNGASLIEKIDRRKQLTGILPDLDDDNLPIRHAHKKRKNDVTQLEGNQGGRSVSLARNSEEIIGKGERTVSHSDETDSRLNKEHAQSASAGSDDDSVIVVEKVDAKPFEEGGAGASGLGSNSKSFNRQSVVAQPTIGQVLQAKQKKLEAQSVAQVTATRANTEAVDTMNQMVNTQVEGNTVRGTKARGQVVTSVPAQVTATPVAETPTTHPQVNATNGEDDRIEKTQLMKRIVVEGPLGERAVPAGATLSPEEVAIEEHCEALKRGIKQLHERMERLQAYSSSHTGTENEKHKSSSSSAAKKKCTAKEVEDLEEENRRLRERVQTTSNNWREKCQERELRFRRVLTEMEERFKKNMFDLHESNLKDVEREREKHRDVLEPSVDDQQHVDTGDLERRVAIATLEAKALSNATEKIKLYREKELEAFTKRLESERESERNFYHKQKEEIILRIKRIGREDTYFRKRANAGYDGAGIRSQNSRPLPSDVLGNNMIYLLMRDLANLEYMADFLRKKMKQEVESGEEHSSTGSHV